MLSASELSKSFGGRVLFHDVTLRLLPRRRCALVGGNGAGKTTLVEILLGLQEPDSGEVHRPNDLRVGYLPQDLPDQGAGTVLATVLEGAAHITELGQRLEHLAERLGATSGAEHDRALAAYGAAQSQFEHFDGYALEADAQRILAGLGFAPDDAQRPITELSGGWRMRAALARLLLAQPDVLVLDEPTNHLDVDSVAWLEQRLSAWDGALLFVSHDRDFIDSVATHVLELAGGTLTEYVGGFAEFVAQREDRITQLEAAAAAQERRVAQAERFIERFRYKATKARQVQSRVKQLARLERVEAPTKRELIAKFAFPEPRRSARVVAELRDVTVGYDGAPVLEGVDLVIERGAKVALVGPNGAGKTTLVRLLSGELAPSRGTVTLGANVDIAYFAQLQTEVLHLDRTVLEEYRRAVGERQGRNLRTALGAFGFRGDAAEQKVGDLSGGEQTRLALAEVMGNPVNLLVLDEPTNHLDLPSCDVLEDALLAYPGTVLLITHDRHLIRSVADALIEVRGGRARWHDGVDEALLSPKGELGTRQAAVKAKPAGTAPTKAGPTKAGPTKAGPARAERKRDEAEQRNQRSRATRDLRQRLAKVERQWEKAEAEVADLQRELAEPALYENPEKVKELVARHQAAKDKATRLMAEWEHATLELERASQP
ncbi:MAG: ATP-binding cassette domain-containing protein [Acidimicrobiales bacterium]